MEFNYFFRNPQAPAMGEGSLKGLNIAIQPNIPVAGWPTEAGSRALLNFKALEDATVIKRLCPAGAYLTGSTPMSEFGFGLEGSLAGEAVKQDTADAELVLDMTGEARLAAAERNLAGYKPGYGLVSRLGIAGLIPSMECCGIISKGIHNIRKIIRGAAGPDEMDFSMPNEEIPDFSSHSVDPSKTNIGVLSEAQAMLPRDQQKMFQDSINEIKNAGFNTVNVSMPEFSLFPLVHNIVGSVEASSCAGRYDSVRYGERAPGAKNWNEMYLLSRGASFGTLLKSYLLQGAFFQFEKYKAFENACRIRTRLIKEINTVYTNVDYLVLPAVNTSDSGESNTLSAVYSQFAYTLFANVTGQPALSIPFGAYSGGAGLQIAGPRQGDEGLLALGEQILSMGRGGN